MHDYFFQYKRIALWSIVLTPKKHIGYLNLVSLTS